MTPPLTVKTPSPAELRAAALAYVARGWFVFPLVPRAKRPIIAGGYHNATRDPAQVNAWWDQWPAANVGIALAPSHLVAFDVDTPAGRDVARTLRPQLTDTLAQRTRSGGFHLIYDTRGRDVPIARDIRKTFAGIDLLSDGYVVAAPSIVDPDVDDKYPHVGAYSWYNLDAAPTPCPDVIAQALRAAAAPTPVPTATATPLGIIPDGQRNTTLFRVACGLVGVGMTPDETLAALARYNAVHCQPPLGDAEIAQLVRQAHKRATNEIFDQLAYEILTDGSFTRALLADADATPTAFDADAPDAAGIPASAYDALIDASGLDKHLTTPLTKISWLPTPYTEINSALGGGLPVGRVSAIIAPPASGKTGMALQIAAHVAAAGTPVLYFSTEIEYDELSARLCALRAPQDVAWRDLISGKGEDQRATLLAGLPITVIPPDIVGNFRASVDLATGFIAATVAAHARKYPGKPALVIVDYIQNLVRAEADTATATTNALSNFLRQFALKTPDVAILTVSSTSRENYGRNLAAMRAITDPTAFLGGAKNAGDLEFDASCVLFLDVDSAIHTTPAQTGYRYARVMISKARYGEPAACGLRFYGGRGQFVTDAAAISALAATVEQPARSGAKPPPVSVEQDTQLWLDARRLLIAHEGLDLEALAAHLQLTPKVTSRILTQALDKGLITKVKRAGAARATRDVFVLTEDQDVTV